MKRKLFTLIVLLVFSSLTACANFIDTDLKSINNILFEETTNTNLIESDTKLLRRFFGIDISIIEDFILYTPSYTMDVDELLIIKLKDINDLDTIANLKDSIEIRNENQINAFSSYGPNQCTLLEDYILKVKGKYIFYCVSKDNEIIYKNFLNSIKGGSKNDF